MSVFKVRLEGENVVHTLTLEEFEEAMGITYLNHLAFGKPKWSRKTQIRALRAMQRGKIGTKSKWLSVYYAQEIEKGEIADVAIEWVDKEIGYGVFAQNTLPKGTFIGEYTGIVRRRRPWSDKKNPYCFAYSSTEIKTPFLVDAEEQGNLTRFINHSDQPNLEPLLLVISGILHIVFCAARTIPKGSQLLYDYGEDYWTNFHRKKRPISSDY